MCFLEMVVRNDLVLQWLRSVDLCLERWLEDVIGRPLAYRPEGVLPSVEERDELTNVKLDVHRSQKSKTLPCVSESR